MAQVRARARAQEVVRESEILMKRLMVQAQVWAQ
jgi:hypothetical protein